MPPLKIKRIKPMKIYRPVRTSLISQTFGKAGTSPSLIPLYNSLGLEAHNGIDFVVKCADNQVVHGGHCEPVYMNVVGVNLTVSSFQKDDKNGFGINAVDEKGNKFCWWHFDVLNPSIAVGRKLTFGEELGIAGNTGMSTGAHLHFGYYPATANKNNLYGGAEDPMPYYDNRFCLDIKTEIGLIQKLIEIYQAILNIIK
jgi:hypothetical protein